VQAIRDDERGPALQRLIDQELLRQQMGVGRFRVQPAAVEQRLQQIRKLYPGAENDQAWHALLLRYGLNEQDLHDYLVGQLRILRFVDLRLRPAVRVDGRSIEAYYRDNFLPELRRRGASEDVPLSQVSASIEEVLLQQQLDSALSSWLQNLRQQSTIRTGLPVYGPSLKAERAIPAGAVGAAPERPGGGLRSGEDAVNP
jgi:hypothetical protein